MKFFLYETIVLVLYSVVAKNENSWTYQDGEEKHRKKKWKTKKTEKLNNDKKDLYFYPFLFERKHTSFENNLEQPTLYHYICFFYDNTSLQNLNTT